MTRRRQRVLDIGAVLLGVAIALMASAEALDVARQPDAYVVGGLILALLGCAGLWWRRTWPVGVALCLLPLATVTEAVGGAVMVAVFTVATRRGWRVTAVMVALHFLASALLSLGAWLWADPSVSLAMYNVSSLTLLIIAALWGTIVRTRRELVESLRERARRAEEEAALRAEHFRSQERERLAREMHDVLAHRISMLSVHAGALEIRPDMGPDDVATAAGAIRVSARSALEDLRQILGVLRSGDESTDARPQPDLDQLETLVTESVAAGDQVQVDDRRPSVPELSRSASRTAYRVIQESLTNARKHAPGATAHVRLERTAQQELHVSVHNAMTPPAADPAPGARAGLVGLTERLNLAGGRLEHGLHQTDAELPTFCVDAWIPWPA